MSTTVFTATVPPNDDEGSEVNSISWDPYASMQNISFTGADAVATLLIPQIGTNGGIAPGGESIDLGELQTISYSVHRENSPIRTLGHGNVRGFVKGGRTIAGSLIFTVFNEYAFYRIKQYKEFLQRGKGFFAPLADMLPPFDIVLSFFNEYGNAAKMKIYGVTIVDEGQTVSIDDLLIEQTYTFMARGIQPMVKLTGDSPIDPRIVDPEVVERLQRIKSGEINASRNVFGDAAVDNLAKLHYLNQINDVLDIN